MSDYSLLIVDDDPTIVEMLYRNIAWQTLGVSVVYKAYGGQAAMDSISANHPDIVLCDIGMPIKNGLDVLRWVHEEKIQTYFIFLTCYDSFEYAKEAINLRAFHYLTKPCPLEEVEQTITKAVTELSVAEANSEKQDRNREFFRELWNGALPGEEKALLETIMRYDIGIAKEEDYRLVLISASQQEPMQAGWDLQLFHYSLRHLMQESILNQLSLNNSVFTESNGTITIVLFIGENALSEQNILQRCGNAMQLCRESLDCVPVMLISQPMKLWQVHSNRDELEFSLQQVLLYPGEVELARNVTRSTETTKSQWNPGEFALFFETWNATEMEEYLGGFLNSQMALNKGNRVEIMHKTHQDILQSFYSYLSKQGIDASAVFDSRDAYEQSRKAERSIPNMISFAKLLLTRTHELVIGNHTSAMVRSAICYIDAHYLEEISRETVADAVCITPNYLSTVFHEETGKTLREYITECRINEAKQRLRNTDDSITDVAFDSGFSSVSYFSTVFRKLYHVSPLSWRKQNRKGGHQ